MFPYTTILESRESVREKRARKRASSALEFRNEPKQNLDANEPENIPEIPDNFLSQSVREYLELGRSIPGKK